MDQKACIIFCRCGAGIAGKMYDKISEDLKTLDVHVFELVDLCAFSLHEKDVLEAIGKDFQKKIVIACYPRAVKNIFKQGDIDFKDFDVLNYKELSPQQIMSELKTRHHIKEGKALYQVHVSDLDVPAWFPVIDESLCSFCGKCARFCLFGVYSFDKKSLKVVNPLSCKNNCPACGRTCPTSAIMFPRLDEKTVLAGASPGANEKKPGEAGLFVMLNDRNRERKNIFRQDVFLMAEKERQKALEELKASMIKKC